MATARKSGPAAVREVEQQLHDIADCDSGVLVDLFLSYRATKAMADMLAGGRLPASRQRSSFASNSRSR